MIFPAFSILLFLLFHLNIRLHSFKLCTVSCAVLVSQCLINHSDHSFYTGFQIFSGQASICQCTAMPDKNRKIAYEHDIIKTPVGNAKIAWSCSKIPTDNHINVGFEVVFLDAIANDNYRHYLGYWIGKSEVIGSVFDNPELLEVGE